MARRTRRREQGLVSQFFSWLVSVPEPPRARARPVQRRSTARRPARTRASAPRPSAIEGRANRIRTLSAKGAQRSEAEDRELSHLIMRNPMPLFGALTLRHNRRERCAGDSEARRQSEIFHGHGGAAACFHGRGHVVLGDLESLTYRPGRGKRARWSWEHASGEQGDGKPKLRGRAKVVADAQTGRVELVGGPARFDPSRGIEG